MSELNAAKLSVTEVVKKRSLLRRLLKEYNVTIEAIMLLPHINLQAVAKVMVRVACLKEMEGVSDKALLLNHEMEIQKCFHCRKGGYILPNYRLRKQYGKQARDTRTSGAVGHISKNCKSKGKLNRMKQMM